MLKFNLKTFILTICLLFLATSLLPNMAWAGGSCSSDGEFVNPDSSAEAIDSHNIIPQEIMNNITKVNKAIDKKVSRFLALGRIVECAGTDFLAKEWRWLFIKVRFPDISIWLAGLIIWILGILLVLIVGYYLCDISFKLGFAILAMPIAISLWPFEKTKQYLGKVVSLMMHCAGIFIFLCLGATYAVALFDAATGSFLEEKLQEACMEYGVDCPKIGGDPLLDALKSADAGALILKVFDLSSFNFLMLMFAGIYGFKLVGDTVTKYAQQFFPDSTGLGKVNPMHKGLTQATDFAKKQVGKVGALAKDVAKTQGKRLGAKAGGKIASGLKKVGQGMQKAGEKMGVAGLLVKGVGKALSNAGKTGENMAKSHENKYQNQGKKGEVKNGVWQPKDSGGGGKNQNNMASTGANTGQGGAGSGGAGGAESGGAGGAGGSGGSNPAGGEK